MANKEVSFNLGIGSSPETEDEKIFPELVRIYNAINSLAVQLDSYTGSMALKQEDRGTPASSPAKTIKSQNTNRLYAVASEDLDVGDIVALYNDAGTYKFRKATANLTPPYPYWGVGAVTKAYSTGAQVEAFTFGLIDCYSGLTAGAAYFLSNAAPSSALNITTTVPGAVWTQYIGIALSGGALFLNPTVIHG
jgi:hypothetical protein